MRKVDDGEKKRKEEEKNVVFSGHYVIASSRPPERRPLERRPLVPICLQLTGREEFCSLLKTDSHLSTSWDILGLVIT